MVIQAISTLWLVPSIDSFFYNTTALLKSDIFRTKKPTPPTVVNLQASDWVHCEEETGVYYQLSQFTYKFVKKKLQIFKVINFAKKNICASQRIHKNYY